MIGFYDGGAVMTKGIEKKMVRRGGRGAKKQRRIGSDTNPLFGCDKFLAIDFFGVRRDFFF